MRRNLKYGNQDQNSTILVLRQKKMRMLDVTKGMLCKAAEQSENQDRMKRMRRATPPPRLRSWLILMLRIDVSFRMLYQLAEERNP
ncbi:hypothetical protein GQ600_2433 [Phytophthora cactorum]|nr:hypothetical protein GQ600_2433 [Phytophthora cactorum]